MVFKYPSVAQSVVSFSKSNFLRLPAIKMTFTQTEVASGDRSDTFASYDMALQELLSHRTVYSRQEIHSQTPGLAVNVCF